MRPHSCLAALLLVTGATTLGAQAPAILLDEVECVPDQENGVIFATFKPEPAGAEPRLYFRWEEHGNFYYVALHAQGEGRYWGVPPKPEERNKMIEYYVALVAPGGKTLARSATHMAPVKNDCDVELTEAQQGVAENLIVGESAIDQKGEEVFGFLCDGIVSRIDANGIWYGDPVCRACIIAWWNKRSFLIPLAVGAGTGIGVLIDDDDEEEVSPDEPDDGDDGDGGG